MLSRSSKKIFTPHVPDGKEAKVVIDQVECLSSHDLVRANSGASHVLIGREHLPKWPSIPDPSTNHNIALATRHEGSGRWFLESGGFNDWKSTGSLLWIHGKRVYLSSPSL